MKAVRSFAALIPLLAGGIGAAGPAAAQNIAQAQTVAAPSAQLSVARFWRGEGATLLEGVVSTAVGSSDNAHPQIELVVTDSTGAVLHTETWTDTVSQQLLQLASGRSDVAISTPVQMRVRPGTYNLLVRMTRGTQMDSVRTQVVAFGAAPVISDLVVSNSIRVLGETDAPISAEARFGRFAITRTARPAIEPSTPKLSYYLELYRPGASADSMAQLEF